MPAPGSILRFHGTRTARERYLADLRSIYGSGIEIPDPDFALEADPAIYDKMERDPVVFIALDTRLNSVIGQDWHIESSDDKPENRAAAALMQEIIEGIKRFGAARKIIYRAALLMARGYAWIEGERKRSTVLGGGPANNVWLPKRLQLDDKRRFRYVPVRWRDERDARRNYADQRLEYYDLSLDSWVPIDDAHRRALIVHTYDDRPERLGHGQGLGVPLQTYFRAKGLAWRDWQQAGERWAQGIVAAKIDEQREGSETNEQHAERWLDLIDQMRSRHALVFGANDEFQVFETTGTGTQIAESQIEYIDRAILRLFTGSVRPSGGDTDTGARSAAETEQKTTDILLQFDRAQLDETLTESLVKCTWELNKPFFSSIGLGMAKMPRFRTKRERQLDGKTSMDVFAVALDKGIPIRKEDVYDAIGVQAPAADDEVFSGGMGMGMTVDPMTGQPVGGGMGGGGAPPPPPNGAPPGQAPQGHPPAPPQAHPAPPPPRPAFADDETPSE